jgi:hypothetical protein
MSSQRKLHPLRQILQAWEFSTRDADRKKAVSNRNLKMFGQLKYAAKYLLGLDRAGNRYTVFPDDTFLVSYPKSGNTWVRFLLSNLIHPNEKVGFSNIDRLLPAPALMSRRAVRSLPRPRVLKSHETFDIRFRRVIYLVRDPRDVAVSEFHFSLKKKYTGPEVSLEEFGRRFIAGETAAYGSWWEHAASWIAPRYGSRDFLLVRYEDLLGDSVAQLARIARCLGVEADTPRLEAAIERSSANRMRELEKKQAGEWTGTKDTRREIPFVRAATSGGWKESLPRSLADEIEAAWAPLLRFLGYELLSENAECVQVPAWIKTGQPF